MIGVAGVAVVARVAIGAAKVFFILYIYPNNYLRNEHLYFYRADWYLKIRNKIRIQIFPIHLGFEVDQ